MRLWDFKLIEFLPKSQLVAQWRELNSIFKKQDKHILINYIYNYPKSYLLTYADKVIAEMARRGIKIKSFEKYDNYFLGVYNTGLEKYEEHNDEYFTICYWNLREKFLRKQKDFSKEVWDKINKLYMEKWL